MDQANELLLPLLTQVGAGFAADMQELHAINKAVSGDNNLLSRQKMQQLLVQQHCGQG